MMQRLQSLWWFSSLGVLLLLDQASKGLMLQAGVAAHPLVLWPGVLQLTLTQNHGVAFSALAHLPASLMLILHTVLLMSLLCLLWLKRTLWQKRTLTKVAMALIVAGAIGNWLDRWRHGAVIDFMDVYGLGFPIFNLADVWLTLGTLLLVWACLSSLKHASCNEG